MSFPLYCLLSGKGSGNFPRTRFLLVYYATSKRFVSFTSGKNTKMLNPAK